MVAEVRPSPNHGERRNAMRPDMILLHYTGMLDPAVALDRLCAAGSEVSAHYLVLEDGASKCVILSAESVAHSDVVRK